MSKDVHQAVVEVLDQYYSEKGLVAVSLRVCVMLARTVLQCVLTVLVEPQLQPTCSQLNTASL